MREEDREHELQANQDGRVYPLGCALRATYDADNHHTLGTDVTGLMIDLSKVPFGPDEVDPPAAARPVLASPPPRSWVTRLGGLFGHRRG